MNFVFNKLVVRLNEETMDCISNFSAVNLAPHTVKQNGTYVYHNSSGFNSTNIRTSTYILNEPQLTEAECGYVVNMLTTSDTDTLETEAYLRKYLYDVISQSLEHNTRCYNAMLNSL